MNKIKTFQGTVYPWHCDHMGHMNVQHYVSMFDQAGWNFFAHLGLTIQLFKERNLGMAALEQLIKYKKELVPGQNIYIESSMMEVREKVLIIKHSMLSVDTTAVAAECELTAIHLDTVKRKSAIFPEAILIKAKEMLYNSNVTFS